MRIERIILMLTLAAAFAAPQILRSQEYLDPPLRWEDAQPAAAQNPAGQQNAAFTGEAETGAGTGNRQTQFGEYQPNPQYRPQEPSQFQGAYQPTIQQPFRSPGEYASPPAQLPPYESGNGINSSSNRVPSMLSGYRFEVIDDVTAEQITRLQEAVSRDENLEQQNKDAILVTLGDALEQIETQRQLGEDAANFKMAASNAAQSAALIQGAIDDLKESQETPEFENLTLLDLDQLVTRQRTIVEELAADAEENQTSITGRLERRQAIRTGLTDVAGLLVELESDLEAATFENETPAQKAGRFFVAATLAAERARQAALNAELEMIEAEEAVGLQQLERERLAIEVAAAEKLLATFEQERTRKSAEEAQSALAQAETQQTEMGEPLLQSSVDLNLELATLSQELTEEIGTARAENDELTARLRRVEKAYREARDRERLIGLSSSVGSVLRQQRNQLPDESLVFLDVARYQERIGTVKFQLFELDQQLISLSQDTIKDEIIAANGSQPGATVERLAERITEVTNSRKTRLDAAYKNCDDLYTVLLSLETNSNRLATQTSEFRTYINERIFWIRSNKTLFTEIELDDSDKPLADPAKWDSVGRRLKDEVSSAPLFYLLFAIVFGGLLALRPQFKFRIQKLGEVAARGSCDTFWPTGRTTLLTILVSLPLLLIPLIVGFRIYNDASSTGDVLYSALGTALLATAWFILPFTVFREMCRLDGLAHRHFSWSEKIVRTLRSNIAWAIPVGALLTFSVSLFYSMESQKSIDLIERVMFVAGMLAMTAVLYGCFRPKSGMFSEYLNTNKNSWANQTSTLWFGAILSIPLSLAVLAFFGYYYTAINLAACVYSTFVFALAIETLRELLHRFILVRRRRAHISSAKRRLKEQKERELEAERELARIRKLEKKQEQRAVDSADDDQETLEIARDAVEATSKATEKNVAEITAATASMEAGLLNTTTEAHIDDNAKKAGKLVSTAMLLVWLAGIWLIWADVLPALRALDNYVIWPAVATAVETESGTDRNPAGEVKEQTAAEDTAATPPLSATPRVPQADNAAPALTSTRVTAKDLLVFLMIATATLVTARNFPSLLEMFFLDQLPVDHSVRNAVKSLTTYAILVIGIIMTFQTISIGWTEVQWLVTALTFGLAFGLQEIFANFVAGIIILFERPMRIGDIVTVDNVSGVVSRIRTRATTIISWDRKEYIIPNKDFITGRLLNWTLSDKINRVVIEVGVAYGSDVDTARKLLYEVCSGHPMTLDDPPTIVTFDRFGDSALNFTVRTFLPDIDSRLPTIDSLHTAINRAFAEAGIEISFPQQDLHLRSIDSEVARLMGGDQAA